MGESVLDKLAWPYDSEVLLRKRKSIKRQLLARENIAYIDKRIAILGGSTTADIKDMLELFLLHAGIRPEFYESEYNKFYEDAVFGNPQLDAFQPEIILVWTSFVNLIHLPEVGDSHEIAAGKLEEEYQRFVRVWEGLTGRYAAIIIQNNLEFPYMSPLGNLDGVLPQGWRRYVNALNEKFAQYAAAHGNFYLHDLQGLAGKIGIEKFSNRFQYYGYKFAVSYDAVPETAASLARIIGAVLGRSRKCLVLDLDNTLWGGVIGDDGIEGIQLGHETPTGEAYMEFQQYVRGLKQRGVILAVASKNEADIARSGFQYPDSVLKADDFAAFYANWQPKDVNIRAMARELNIGLDSLVFIDDNPAEREIVRQSLPEVAVPEVDVSDVFSYIRAIEGNGYFEAASLSADDFARSAAYIANSKRAQLENAAASYEDYLISLEMEAEIAPFKSLYYDRITQLTNKTNQFNLTTRRCTQAEIEVMAEGQEYITLYGRLSDRFGDNGLVTVVAGKQQGDNLEIILWLMSCRVLQRGMEYAMLDALVAAAKEKGICTITGVYIPTKKNPMVAKLYSDFGFQQVSAEENGTTIWQLSVKDYKNKGRFIKL